MRDLTASGVDIPDFEEEVPRVAIAVEKRIGDGTAAIVRRAVRDLPFGYVRVRAVTATNQIGTSAAHRFRR